VARARKLEAAYRAAEAQGLGAAQVDGVMIDVATVRLVRNTLMKADLIGM
jgi:citrate lyase subunit beta/citryl-CoA lyase